MTDLVTLRNVGDSAFHKNVDGAADEMADAVRAIVLEAFGGLREDLRGVSPSEILGGAAVGRILSRPLVSARLGTLTEASPHWGRFAETLSTVLDVENPESAFLKAWKRVALRGLSLAKLPEVPHDELVRRAVAYAESHGAELVQQVTRSTRLALREAVTKALDDGTSRRDLFKAIEPLIGLTKRQMAAAKAEMARNPKITAKQRERILQKHIRRRANLISEHESNAAMQRGVVEAWRAAQADGADIRGLGDDDVFVSRTGRRSEGPTEHVRCRCTVRLVLLDGAYWAEWVTRRMRNVPCAICDAFDGTIRGRHGQESQVDLEAAEVEAAQKAAASRRQKATDRADKIRRLGIWDVSMDHLQEVFDLDANVGETFREEMLESATRRALRSASGAVRATWNDDLLSAVDDLFVDDGSLMEAGQAIARRQLEDELRSLVALDLPGDKDFRRAVLIRADVFGTLAEKRRMAGAPPLPEEILREVERPREIFEKAVAHLQGPMAEIKKERDALLRSLDMLKKAKLWKAYNDKVRQYNAVLAKLKPFQDEYDRHLATANDAVHQILRRGKAPTPMRHLFKRLAKSKSKRRHDVETAFDFLEGIWGRELPTSAWKVSATDLQFKSHRGRSHFIMGSKDEGTVVLYKNAHDRTAVHELGHWLEWMDNDVHKSLVAEYHRRTFGDSVEALGGSYRSKEITLPDEFSNRYTGKIYGKAVPRQASSWNDRRLIDVLAELDDDELLDALKTSGIRSMYVADLGPREVLDLIRHDDKKLEAVLGAHEGMTVAKLRNSASYAVVKVREVVDQHATELLSMGLEYLYSDPLRLAKEDPRLFEMVVGLIRTEVQSVRSRRVPAAAARLAKKLRGDPKISAADLAKLEDVAPDLARDAIVEARQKAAEVIAAATREMPAGKVTAWADRVADMPLMKEALQEAAKAKLAAAREMRKRLQKMIDHLRPDDLAALAKLDEETAAQLVAKVRLRAWERLEAVNLADQAEIQRIIQWIEALDPGNDAFRESLVERLVEHAKDDLLKVGSADIKKLSVWSDARADELRLLVLDDVERVIEDVSTGVDASALRKMRDQHPGSFLAEALQPIIDKRVAKTEAMVKYWDSRLADVTPSTIKMLAQGDADIAAAFKAGLPAKIAKMADNIFEKNSLKDINEELLSALIHESYLLEELEKRFDKAVAELTSSLLNKSVLEFKIGDAAELKAIDAGKASQVLAAQNKAIADFIQKELDGKPVAEIESFLMIWDPDSLLAKKIEVKLKKLKAQAKPPAAKPEPTFKTTPVKVMNGKKWKKVGDKAGSNEGGFFETPAGVKYYVKVGDETHLREELAAHRLYKAAGIRVPTVQLVQIGDRIGIASKVVDAKAVGKDVLAKLKDVQNAFVVDAWLANWDVVGLSLDNIMVSGSKAWRIDVGGALRFRAQGKPKGSLFGSTVSEIQSLRNSNQNAQAAAVFEGITNSDLVAQIKKLETRFTDGVIRSIVDSIPDLPNPDALAKVLIARRNHLVKLRQELEKAVDLDKARKDYWKSETSTTAVEKYWKGTTVNEEWLLALSKAEVAALTRYSGAGYYDLNKWLRQNAGQVPIKRGSDAELIDKALRKAALPRDTITWRGASWAAVGGKGVQVGDVVTDHGFASTAMVRTSAFSGDIVLEVLIPAGREGAGYIRPVSHFSSEYEVLLTRGSRFRVLAVDRSGYQAVITVEWLGPDL